MLSGELGGFDEADALKLAAFVEAGGIVLSFNESVVALNKAFPNILKYKGGRTTGTGYFLHADPLPKYFININIIAIIYTHEG